LLIVEFKNTFVDKQEYDDLLIKLGANKVKEKRIYLRDPNLRSKLKKELPTIFNFFLEGRKRLELNNFEFTKTQNVLDSLEKNRQDASPVYNFLKENYIIDNKSFESTKALYQHYKTWYKENINESTMKCPSKNKFSEEVARSYDIKSDRSDMFDGTRKVTLRGYHLKKTEPWHGDPDNTITLTDNPEVNKLKFKEKGFIN
jgi:hypothetical protein